MNSSVYILRVTSLRSSFQISPNTDLHRSVCVVNLGDRVRWWHALILKLSADAGQTPRQGTNLCFLHDLMKNETKTERPPELKIMLSRFMLLQELQDYGSESVITCLSSSSTIKQKYSYIHETMWLTHTHTHKHRFQPSSHYLCGFTKSHLKILHDSLICMAWYCEAQILWGFIYSAILLTLPCCLLLEVLFICTCRLLCFKACLIY